MPVEDADFATIMAEEKRIISDIEWAVDEDHSPARTFRVDVDTDAGWPLFVQGRYNPQARKLSYSVILRTNGRIYGLDLGRNHAPAGENHKHRNREVYSPDDITAPYNDPVAVWTQFCREAGIQHNGRMYQPSVPRRLFI